jgi:glycosyltransferase involved in cell wall biosynthesis
MEYAIRQSAAIAREGVEVHFLCKPSFPVERLGAGIQIEKLKLGKAETLKNVRGPVGKVGRVVKMILDLRANGRQVAELAEELAFSPKAEGGTTKFTNFHEKGKENLTTDDTDGHGYSAGQRLAGQAGAAFSNLSTSELARDSENTSLNRSAIAPASETNTRDLLPDSRHNLGEAEVAVLFACYKEYFAPFWVWPLRRLAKKGIVIGTIAHDPVRDFVVGPIWWHRWSVRLGYSFVRDVFVHDDTPLDFGGKKPAGIRIHQIPHGPYEVAEPIIGREAMRRRLGFDSGLTAELANAHEEAKFGAADSGALISDGGEAALDSRSPATSHPIPVTPASPDVVFLAFGQIRDGKNLDLFLRVMTRLPENVKLLVAGKGDSGSSRPAEYYQKLAEEL